MTASEAKRVTDRMMVTAAEALGNLSLDDVNADTQLLPPIDNMRDVAIQIAAYGRSAGTARRSGAGNE